MKIYLGDSVYCEFDGTQIKLTTENGLQVTNTIFLETSMLPNIGKLIEKKRSELRRTVCEDSLSEKRIS